MNIAKGDYLRRLIPAFVVGGVVAFSFLAQVPTLASNNDVGYGYRNNCGVKGDGFHDHGKVCPNRPFPGHGNGVLRILAGLGTTTGSSATTNGGENHESSTIAHTTSGTGSDAQSQINVGQAGKSHGKGHGKGHRPA